MSSSRIRCRICAKLRRVKGEKERKNRSLVWWWVKSIGVYHARLDDSPVSSGNRIVRFLSGVPTLHYETETLTDSSMAFKREQASVHQCLVFGGKLGCWGGNGTEPHSRRVRNFLG